MLAISPLSYQMSLEYFKTPSLRKNIFKLKWSPEINYFYELCARLNEEKVFLIGKEPYNGSNQNLTLAYSWRRLLRKISVKFLAKK